jgi:enamine deaminase RidA (YjgF/YER057c/UK114 family)
VDIKRHKTVSRMSQAVIHNNLVYLAGQIPADTIGKSFADRTRNTLQRIDSLLAEVGTHKGKILSATIYLADLDDFEEMNSIWDAWIPAGSAPARATVGVGLGPGFGIEISIIAALP